METIRVDSREDQCVIEAIRTVNPDAFSLPTMLPVGDFVFGSTVFERKVFPGDFEASIKDGRINQQISNMEENFDWIFLILEGWWWLKDWESGHGLKKQAVQGMIDSIMVRHPLVRVVFTEDPCHTIWTIVNICEKISDPRVIDKTVRRRPKDMTVGDIVHAIGRVPRRVCDSLEARGYTTHGLCHTTVQELLTIDGVGATTAKKIKEVFNDGT